MVYRGRGARLTPQALGGLIVQPLLAEHFDRHRPLKALVVGLIDHAHAALA